MSGSRYEDVCRFFFDEAALLDDGEFYKWLDCMSPDLVYKVATRVTRERRWTGPTDTTLLFDDTLETLRLRIDRLGTEYAWSEDPPSRTRHLVSNVRIHEPREDGGIPVSSAVMIYRSRGGSTKSDLLVGARADVLRDEGGTYRIAERMVTLDQSTLGSMNLSFFL